MLITNHISFLPLLSKALEKVVYLSLVNHVQTVLTSQQHGFMPRRTYVTNLRVMLREAWDNISAGSQPDVIYTDYASAFQSVYHQLLVSKMQKSYHLSGQALA